MPIDTHFAVDLSDLVAFDAGSLDAGSFDAGSPGGTSLSGPQPLITGPAPILAGGVVAICLFMLLVFFLLMRGRARRAVRRREVEGKDFFQPAGEDADISFDDDRPLEAEAFEPEPPEDVAIRETRFGEQTARFVTADQGDLGGEVHLEETPEPTYEEPKEKPKKKGPFAGLFSRGKKSDAEEEHASYDDVSSETDETFEADTDDIDAEFASVSIVSGAKSANLSYDAPAHEAEAQAAYQQQEYHDTDYRDARARAEREAAEIRARAEADAADARRRAEADAAAMRRRAEEEAERQAEARRLEERKRFQEEEAAHERARLAAAEAQLAEREKKLSSEASNLEAEISRRLEERFAALAANYDSDENRYGEDERPAGEMRLSGRASDDDVYQTLEAVEEALVAQSEALKAETRNQLDQFADRFEKRMASLSALMEQSRVASAVSTELGGGTGDSNAIADLIAQRLSEHRDSVNNTLAALSKRIDEITKGPEDVSGMRKEMAALRTSLGERNLGPTAPLVQLADIIGNALPPNAYSLGAILSNGRKADCLVKLPHPPGPVAIDARFPVEAFNRLHEAHNDREAAENEFRRTALRHIVDIAERLISPEETAESALMFIPSESMYAEFHARFPDVVQDSYRARVWIVSPTTLMATLHTIRAILRDARSRENAGLIQAEAQHVLTEVEQLRQRVASLETSFDRARDDVRSLASSTDKVYRRAETITNTGRALAEENLDRGSRRIISAPADDDREQSARHQPRATASSAQAAPSQHVTAHDGAPERSDAPEGAPTIYRDNPYRRGSDKISSHPKRDPDRPQTPFPLR